MYIQTQAHSSRHKVQVWLSDTTMCNTIAEYKFEYCEAESSQGSSCKGHQQANLSLQPGQTLVTHSGEAMEPRPGQGHCHFRDPANTAVFPAINEAAFRNLTFKCNQGFAHLE